MAAAVTACWVVLWTVTGSLVAGTLVLLFLAALVVVAVLALRALGLTRDHPWVGQIATRPWRDGQEVLQLALRHLPEVFVVTPSGALLAPTSVELRLSPRDFGSLGGGWTSGWWRRAPPRCTRNRSPRMRPGPPAPARSR